jgi:hypothetical protein
MSADRIEKAAIRMRAAAEAAGFEPEPGWVVLAGAATAAEVLTPGIHRGLLSKNSAPRS